MVNVHFPKPSRFEVFKLFYIKEQQRRHHDNSHWKTFAQVYENLGGFECIYNVFCAFCQVSPKSQKTICGFTNADINQFLEQEDAGKVCAEAFGE